MTVLAEHIPLPSPSLFRAGRAPRPELTLVPSASCRAPALEAATPALRREGPSKVLIDMENMCGTGDPGFGLVRSVWASLAPLLQPGDSVVIATGHLCAGVVKMALRHTGAQFLVRGGKNGADRALIDSADLAEIAASNSWLIIASGDGAFTSLMRHAPHYGLHTWLITGEASASQPLTAAATIHSRLRIKKPGRYIRPAAPVVCRPVAA